jgi:hypothetical protein
LAFARRLRIWAAVSFAVPPPVNGPSSTGAILRASRTITKAIAISSATAATSASRTTLLELELVVDSVEAVVAVVVVGVVSCPPCVSSLNALPPLAAADIASGAATPVNASAPMAQRHATTRRLGDLTRRLPDTHASIASGRTGVEEMGPRTRLLCAGVPQTVEWRPMAPKQRQIRIEQRGGLEAIQALEQRSDEELENETKYKSAALAILGARASERFDAEQARAYFQRAIAAARPQERMQLRRMADASLALAERRAGDLKSAVERLGQTPPSGRQMFALRAMGLLIPPASAGVLARVRGILLIVLLIAVLIAIGLGVVELVSLPFGGLGLAPGILLGLFVVIAALVAVAAIGRRRRDRAKAAAGGSS